MKEGADFVLLPFADAVDNIIEKLNCDYNDTMKVRRISGTTFEIQFISPQKEFQQYWSSLMSH
jgi:hypothetical protein